MLKNVFAYCLTLFVFSTVSFSQVELVTENQAGISQRLQHDIDMTKDPKLGFVPKWKLIDAYKYKKEKIKENANSANITNASGTSTTSIITAAAATSFTWTERGPFKDAVGPSNGNTRPGNGITSGRVRAIWEDLSDAGKTIWVGGIDGGIWKTSDITSNPSTWTPINDELDNLAIASICQDPSNFKIMYFGTGEKAINADAVRGAGIWQSIDGGLTWTIMPGTASFWNVSKVICDAAGNLYVGCNSVSNTAGLQRYTKSSGTWIPITPSGLQPRITDMVLSSTGRLHVSCGYYNTATANAGYRFTANPESVTPTTWTSPATTFTTQYNVALACSGNTLYALPSNSAFEVPTIFKSTDGGANWAATTTTPAFTSGQSWYNMAVQIDPNDANKVIVGALDCYRSINGGGTWTKISNWVGTTGQYVHADQQIILWNSSNRVLVGSDGGVHYSADGGTTFSDRNSGLRIKQFYSVAVHPTSTNYFLGGTQDNGTHQLNGAGLTSSIEVTGGDGAFVHIDQDQPAYQWGSYVYSNYRRSSDGGNTWSSPTANNTGRFINPTDYDDVNNIMYGSYSANTFARWSNAQTGGTITSVAMSTLGNGTVSAIKVSPYTSNTVFFAGGGSGIVPSLIKATSANATPVFTSIIATGMTTSSTNISSIELGTDENNIMVAYSNYGVINIWVTTNGGTSWTTIDGNLPDMPVRWVMFYPGDNSRAIIATETGVWQTALINGTATIWDPEPSFPNVRTDMIQYRSSDRLLAASTHGRGLFTTNVPIFGTINCGNTTNLISSPSFTSATIGWSLLTGSDNYDVDYKLATSSTWINAATKTTTNSVNISGLVSNSTYDYRVRANCTAGAGPFSYAQFKTLQVCGTVTGLASSSITSTGATLAWTALSGAANYDVDYQVFGALDWTNRISKSTSLTISLTGLTSGTRYSYRVRANCTNNLVAGSYTQAEFSTLATCPSSTTDNSANNVYKGAETLALNTDRKSKIEKGGDEDYFKFNITQTGSSTITLTTLPADYNLTLYNSEGISILASSVKTGTTAESISHSFLSTGTYYIRINGATATILNTKSCYTLKVALGTAQGTVAQLPIVTSASAITKIETAKEVDNNFSAKIYPNPTKDRLTVYVLGNNTKRTLTMYDATGRIVYNQGLNEMFTTLSLQKVSNGIYFIKIKSETGEVIYSERIIKN